MVIPSRRYAAPSGKVGRRFVRTLGVEMQGVRERRWNSERFIVFQTVILQRSRHVTASHAIRQRIAKRLDAWGEGKHAMLVRNTLRSCGTSTGAHSGGQNRGHGDGGCRAALGRRRTWRDGFSVFTTLAPVVWRREC